MRSPTAQKAQSKLWYAEGAWWAGLLAPSSDRIKIFRLDWATQTWKDTGTVVDERPTADPDYLAVGDHLYVASAGSRPSASSAGRFLRFTYDRSAKRYLRDPDFPVRVTDVGTNAIVIARDGAERLWITFVAAGKVMVAHTDGNDAHWTVPYALPGSGTLRAEDISSVIAFGPGRIGVMWSDQQRQQMLFASHADGEPDDAWTPVEVVAEGAGSADNHLNLKTFVRDGKELIAAAVKLARRRDGPQPARPPDPRDDPHGRRRLDRLRGGPRADKHSRPIVLVDETRRLLYVVAQSPFGGGAIYVKRTDLDHPVFPTGKGDLLIVSTKDLEIANPTSTKGSISSDTGLVVMASDDQSGRYLHAALDLGGTPIPAGVAAIARPDRPPVTEAGRTASSTNVRRLGGGWRLPATAGPTPRPAGSPRCRPLASAISCASRRVSPASRHSPARTSAAAGRRSSSTPSSACASPAPARPDPCRSAAPGRDRRGGRRRGRDIRLLRRHPAHPDDPPPRRHVVVPRPDHGRCGQEARGHPPHRRRRPTAGRGERAALAHPDRHRAARGVHPGFGCATTADLDQLQVSR